MKPLLADIALSIPVGSWHPALPAMVRSVLGQSVTPELAIFDASGDVRVAEALAPLRPLSVHWHDGPDGGQAAAIQSGWNATSAPICGWLNADDLLYPEALECVVRQFSADADVVTGQSIFMDAVNAYTGLHPGVRPMGPEIRRGNIISQPSTFVRRERIDAVGGLDASRHFTMDWDLWVRLFDDGATFRQTDQVLSAVTMEEGTKTSAFTARRRQELLSILSRHGGAITQIKALIGFWRRHRAEQAEGEGRTDRSYERRVSAETGQRNQVLAGIPFSIPSSVELANLSDQTVTQIHIDAEGTLAEGCALLLPEPLAPGQSFNVTLTPTAGPVLLRGLRLV